MTRLIYQSYILERRNRYVVSLQCKDYGYECKYVTEGEIDFVIDDYKQHMDKVHGIDYSKEAVAEFIKRKS